MIWFFKRDDDVLRVETRFDNDTREYVTVLHETDGSQKTERFKDAESFGAYLLSVERRLASEHWQQAGGPQFQREGWFEAALREH